MCMPNWGQLLMQLAILRLFRWHLRPHTHWGKIRFIIQFIFYQQRPRSWQHSHRAADTVLINHSFTHYYLIIPTFIIQRKLQAFNKPLNTTRLCSLKAFGLILMKIPWGAFSGWDIILSSIHVWIYFSPAPTVPPCGIKSFTLLVRVRPDLNKPYMIPMVRSPSWGTRMVTLMGSINWPV